MMTIVTMILFRFTLIYESCAVVIDSTPYLDTNNI